MICIRPVLTPASLAKFTISPVGFAHSLAGAKNSNHKILRKLNFSVRISYLLPTCQEKLMDELPAKSVVSIRLGESLLNIIRGRCMLEKPGTVSNSLNTPVPGSQKFSSNFYKVTNYSKFVWKHQAILKIILVS